MPSLGANVVDSILEQPAHTVYVAQVHSLPTLIRLLLLILLRVLHYQACSSLGST